MREEILAYKRERNHRGSGQACFYARGFTGPRFDDHRCRNSALPKPFIYTHFRSKVELLAALCKPTIEIRWRPWRTLRRSPAADRTDCIVQWWTFTHVVLSRQANIAIYFREEKNLTPEALNRDQRTAQDRHTRAMSPVSADRRAVACCPNWIMPPIAGGRWTSA